VFASNDAQIRTNGTFRIYGAKTVNSMVMLVKALTDNVISLDAHPCFGKVALELQPFLGDNEM
jgi:hypothetical protein